MDRNSSHLKQDDMEKQIDVLLEESVRPTLRAHGGDVELARFDGQVLYLRLLGQCAGCPSAGSSTEQMIRDTILNRFSAVKQVEFEQWVSEDLLAAARKLLNNG